MPAGMHILRLRALLFAATTVSGLTTLYDLPVSNHGARVRLLLYKKGLESAVKIVSPQELGGLRSDEYKALSPQGKMPLLVEDDGTSVWESDAICRHLLDKHADTGPSLRPSTLASRTAAEVICRHHDAYLGPIQGCLYKPAPPFGRFGTRAAALRELVEQLELIPTLTLTLTNTLTPNPSPNSTPNQCEQLEIVEALVDPTGPYLTGPDFSLADATLFPTMVFVAEMLPKFEEAAVRDPSPEPHPNPNPSSNRDRNPKPHPHPHPSPESEQVREVSPHAEPRDAAAGALGPKLLAWWAHMSNTDVEAMRVAAEIRGGLEAWEKNERWAPLRHAGTRDEAERTLFDMILAGDIPSDKVYEDEVCPDRQ